MSKINCFSSEVMKNMYQKYNDVVLVDSTYKTNKYKMPLLVFGAINNLNKTFLLGFAVIKDETYASVHWVFQQLFNYLGSKPTIIVSDSCKTLRKCIVDVLEGSTHLLCGWHVSQNIKSHLTAFRKTFFIDFNFEGSHMNQEEINQIINLPYISSKNEVEKLFEKILSLNISETTKNYYKEKLDSKEMWCMAYKKDLSCLRIGTTLRIEGINAIIKAELNASSRLVELLLRMLDIHQHILNKNYFDGSNVSNLLLENLKENPLLKSIKESVSEYVYHQIALSISKSFELVPKLYKGKYTIIDKNEWKIEIDKADPKCSCKYFVTTGIPCSHLISAALKNKDFPIQGLIKKRWLKEPFELNLSDSELINDIKSFLFTLKKEDKDKEENSQEEQKEAELLPSQAQEVKELNNVNQVNPNPVKH